MPKAPLAVVRSSPRQGESPPTLGEIGRKLWLSVQGQYAITDSGGLAILEQACAAGERAQLCADRIAADGMIIETKNGPKDHPLLRHEAVARALCCRLLTRLGINIEPTRSVGRPSGGLGIGWWQE